MLELSTPERRYLTAACSASPLYAFRPRVVGRVASFADGDTDKIISSLRRAGMVQLDSDRNARLTEEGRTAARGSAEKPDRRVRGRHTLMMAGVALAAVVAIVAAGVLLL